MAAVYEENVKPFMKDNRLRCKCGSCRYEIIVYPGDDSQRDWIMVSCKKCNATLFYNGA